jgi:plasmid stabilization system protein ParE
VRQLKRHPQSGSYVDEDETKTYRQLIQGNYRIIYRFTAEQVVIVAVYHAARLLAADDLD